MSSQILFYRSVELCRVLEHDDDNEVQTELPQGSHFCRPCMHGQTNKRCHLDLLVLAALVRTTLTRKGCHHGFD